MISWSICGPKPNVVGATRHEKVTTSAKERGSRVVGLAERNGRQGRVEKVNRTGAGVGCSEGSSTKRKTYHQSRATVEDHHDDARDCRELWSGRDVERCFNTRKRGVGGGEAAARHTQQEAEGTQEIRGGSPWDIIFYQRGN